MIKKKNFEKIDIEMNWKRITRDTSESSQRIALETRATHHLIEKKVKLLMRS